jgi:hypothetical protein
MTLRGNKDKKSSSENDGGPVTSITQRPVEGQRHGSTESSGADSYRSSDTIRSPFAGMKVNTAAKKFGYVDLSF